MSPLTPLTSNGRIKYSSKIAALAVVSSLVFATSASADCNGLNTEFNALEAFANLACTVAPDDVEWAADACMIWDDISESDIPTSAVDVWNIFADDGPLSLGPRSLDAGITVSGKLVEPGHRVFLLSSVADHEIDIDLNYERGRAGLELDVCTLDSDGNRERVARLVDPRDDQQGLNETVTLDAGSVVIFKLNPTGNPLNAYKYNLNVTLNNAPLPATTLEPNVDRPGSDYRNFPLGSIASTRRSGSGVIATTLRPVNARRVCRRACADDAQCQSWTFVKGDAPKQPHCWLKNSVPAPVSTNCCDSGVKN